MHDDLKTLLRAGWSFGVHFDPATESFRVVGKRGNEAVRGIASEPIEALARAVVEAQIAEAR